MKKSFTLIEIIVVVAVISLLVGGGVIDFVKFNERETVKNAAKKLISYLRLAQTKAMTGEKSEKDCGVNQSLDGWCVDLYRKKIYGHCGGIDSTVNFKLQNVDLPEGVTLTFHSSDGSSCPNCAILRFLPAPRSGVDKSSIICLSGFGKTYKIIVPPGGEIEDVGFVSSCP